MSPGTKEAISLSIEEPRDWCFLPVSALSVVTISGLVSFQDAGLDPAEQAR